MPMFKTKPPKKPPLYRLEPFKGIDLSTTSTQISEHNSPDMLNFNIDERGALNKRTGYERVFQTSLGTGKINGIFQFNGVFLIAHGTNLYTQSGSDQPVSIYSNKADADTSFFVMEDKCYIMDGTNFLVYDGTTVSKVEDNPYIPTLTIARAPSGGGTPNEDFNLLGAGFKDSFSADGTATIYQLSLTGLDATTVTAVVNGVNKTEGTDFTVDRTLGKVTFTTAPTTGTDNVIITAYKTYADKPLDIKKCRFNVLFGGNNDTRVFISGNPDKSNYVWRSGLYDPSYWPENGFYKIGNHEAVQGFAKQYDYLVIFKEHSMWNMQYSLPSGATEPSFPLKPINDKVGTLAQNSIQIIQNNPISLDEKGVYAVTSTNVRDEINVQHVSERVDAKLLVESNLQNAISVDFDRKYWLVVNNNAYIFDYAINEWYIYNNITANCFYVSDSTLYFGSNTDGIVYQFKKTTDLYPYNDDGVAINAYWYSKLINFQSPEMLKIVRHIYMTIKPDVHTSADLYLRTDKKGEYFVATKRVDQFNLLYLDLTKFSLITSDIPQELSKKLKEKKITHIQFKLQNNALDESLGVTSFGIDYEFQRAVK